jgi:hypothetical protein
VSNFIIIILVAAGFAGFIWFLLRNKTRNNFNRMMQVDVSNCRISNTTPLGVKVLSVNPLHPELIPAIDGSLTELFAMCRRRGYTQKLNHDDYKIYVIPPEREYDSLGNYVPNFKLRADEYDGTVFDQNPTPGIGEVYAAEYVAPDFSCYVIAEYTRDFETTARDAVRYGAEHIILKFNDEAEFNRTAFHGNGIGHPIITE